MPADLVSKKEIPELAGKIDSPAMLRVLRRLEQAGFLMNSLELDEETKGVLRRLTNLGLADPGYEEAANGKVGKLFIWVANGNGKRVLKYFDQIQESKLTVGLHAQTALRVLEPDIRWAILATVQWHLLRDPASWPPQEAQRFRPNEPLYVLRIPPDWLAFIRVLEPGHIELFDIMLEGTLRMFQEGFSERSTVR